MYALAPPLPVSPLRSSSACRSPWRPRAVVGRDRPRGVVLLWPHRGRHVRRRRARWVLLVRRAVDVHGHGPARRLAGHGVRLAGLHARRRVHEHGAAGVHGRDGHRGLHHGAHQRHAWGWGAALVRDVPVLWWGVWVVVLRMHPWRVGRAHGGRVHRDGASGGGVGHELRWVGGAHHRRGLRRGSWYPDRLAVGRCIPVHDHRAWYGARMGVHDGRTGGVVHHGGIASVWGSDIGRTHGRGRE